MKINNFKSFFKKLALIFFILGLVFFLGRKIINSVNNSNSKELNSNPKTLLKHANTYYWFARANGNTNHEFEKANQLAKTALNLIQKSKNKFHDKNDSITAQELLTSTEKYIDSNYLTINNHFPLYSDMMGLNQFIDEDQPNEELEKVVTQKALNKLLNSIDFNSSKTIGSIPYYAIVKHKTKKILEDAVEYININSNIYTISDHEIASITSENNIDINKIVNDSITLNKITNHYKSKQLIIIELIPQDEYEGIHYYGARAFLYNHPQSDRYIETFVKNRFYNNVTDFKLPLFLIFLSIILIGGIIYNFFDRNKNKTEIIRYIIYASIALIINIICIEVIANFLSPNYGDYFDIDEVNLWSISVILTFNLIPIFLLYLIIGKVDNLIENFDSKLDNKNSLFSILFSALSTFSIVLVYYNINRFGISIKVTLSIFTFIPAYFFSLTFSKYWHNIRLIPYQTSLFKKIYSWSILIVLGIDIILFQLSYFSILNIENSINSVIYLFIIPLLIITLIDFIIYKTIFKANTKNNLDLIKNNFKYIPNENEIATVNILSKYKSVVIYGPEKSGKTSFINKISKEFIIDKQIKNLIKIDFEIDHKSKNKVNYNSYLEGFGKYLPKYVFNDQAEGAKKSGNIIGKIINSIASAGDLLIDDSEAKPANFNQVSKILINKIKEFENCLIIFENIHLAKNENLELLEQLLNDLRIYYSKNEQEKNHFYIYSSLEGFHIKKDFENIIEDIINLNKLSPINISTIKQNHNSPFIEFKMDSNYLSNYLNNYNFSIFDKVKLIHLFNRKDRNSSPFVINETLKKLIKQQFIIETNGSYIINENKNNIYIPENPIDYINAEEVASSLNDELFDFIRECSHCTLNDGKFEVEVIAAISNLDKLKALNLLRKLEKENIVYDLKDGWYSFNDIRLIHYFKRDEEIENYYCSQLAKEIYLRWINFYKLKINNLNLNHNIIESLKKLKDISLFLVKEYPSDMYYFNIKIGEIFNQPNLSLLMESESCFNNAKFILKKGGINITTEEENNFLVTCILRNFRFQNALNSEDVDLILNMKNEIIKTNPSLKHELNQTEFLKYVKSNSYKPTIALQKIDEINTIISTQEMNEVDDLRYNFSKILLTPKNLNELDQNEKLEKLIDLENQYLTLIEKIECNKKLMDIASNEGIYQELLNSLGSLYCDSIIVNEIIQKSQLDKYFTKGFEVLSKRLKIESTKINYSNIKLNTSDIIEIIQKIQEVGNMYQIDRKGLAFTFNFLTRLICNRNNPYQKFKFDKDEERDILEISKFAFKLNLELNDIAGITMAASFYGKILSSINKKAEAFEVFKISFIKNFYDNSYQANRAISNLSQLDLSLKHKQEINDYKNLILERHLLRHFSNINNKKKLINLNIVKNEQDLEDQLNIHGSKFDETKIETPKELIEIISKKINENKITKQIKFDTEFFEIEFDHIIGLYNLINKREIEANKISSIKKVERNGNECYKISNIPLKQTNIITVILNNNQEISTIFPGHYAPNFPNRCVNESEREYAKEFWENHVFIN